MAEVVRQLKASLHPVLTPRVQRIRQQISDQELELRLLRLGLAPELSFSHREGTYI
ncbi:hypothetical protein [Prochlorococcus sp. MIT 1341]|uniref:hypothetical protein n=1 Tax=Prochlorococcus sp. MIT 1341 TaxID=3096221 RepID=UPI002A7543D6|nr:hypothetical protein [Prochlorococcus sp. MIT 1341]